MSSQIASMRPPGATDIVPNHWYALVPTSSLILTDELHVLPPSVLREKRTSAASLPEGFTVARRYTLPLVVPSDLSTAIQA